MEGIEGVSKAVKKVSWAWDWLLPAMRTTTTGTEERQYSNGTPIKMKKIAVDRTISCRVIWNFNSKSCDFWSNLINFQK